MCIVVEKADVCATNIFVAPDSKKERQIVVYSNTVDTSFEKNLMVLAVPNPESVDFVDLSGYEEFFDDVEKYFKKHEVKILTRSKGVYKCWNGDNKLFRVHEVGNFLASICNNIDDLKKINSKIFGKINDDALDFMNSKYHDSEYGFIVCKLKKGNYNYHPFAYTHKIYNDTLFVPTMHYHGDEKQRIAHELKIIKEYNDNGLNKELKKFEDYKKVNGTFYSDEVYQDKMDKILNKYKNNKIELDYEWDHDVFIVNNKHDYTNYDGMLDQQMFKKNVNFDIGKINAISKITKNGTYKNGDTIISINKS